MSRRSTRLPSYRLHKPSGRAVVTLGGKDFYLGPHGSEASKSEYNRIVAEWVPEPLARTEIKSLLDGTRNQKHRVMLMPDTSIRVHR